MRSFIQELEATELPPNKRSRGYAHLCSGSSTHDTQGPNLQLGSSSVNRFFTLFAKEPSSLLQQLPHPFNLRTNALQLFFDVLVAAVNVIDAVNDRLAFGDQRG